MKPSGGISPTTLFLAALLMYGCAAGYRPLRPEVIRYTEGGSEGGITSAYRYDVLSESGNTRYSKNERKTNVKLVALKITNNSDRAIVPSRDLAFQVGSMPAVPMKISQVKWKLDQGVPIYLLYLLLTPLSVNISNNNGTIDQYPVGYALGPGLTLLNMLTAGSANAKLKSDLQTYSVDREIPPGQSYYFVVGFEGTPYEPISVKQKSAQP